MTRLADDKVLAHVRGGHEAERANQRRRAVGQDIAVEIGRDDDVVVTRLAEQLVHHRVDDLLFDLEHLVLLVCEDAPGDFAEEAVGLAEHVALVGDGDEAAGVDGGEARVAHALAAQRDVARHGGDVGRRRLRDALDGFGDARAVGRGVRLFFLDVQVFGIFTDDDEVDGAGGGAGGFHGAHVGVEAQAFAEGDDGRGVALDFGAGRSVGGKVVSFARSLSIPDTIQAPGCREELQWR